ncbi:alanine racemase [Klebsiella pneumoniae]|nr:alanine racemase [Klebsiella pneumoniae]
MNDIAHNLAQVRDKISGAAARCGRAPEEVTLLAVSKTKPASAIEEAIAAGQRAFGENYVQEGVEKINHFQQAGVSGLQWHFIGPLQSNKSRLVAEHFDWCHTVDRLKIATRLNEQRPAHLPPLKVLIQINISDEQSKSGIPLEALDGLAAEIAELPHLELRGLMAIPAPESEYVRQFAVARQMAVAFARLKTRYPTVDTLSLGMSDDMEAAIAAGSTMVAHRYSHFWCARLQQIIRNLRNAMKTLTFLLSTVIELYTMVVLLRVWMQWARCDFYNPFSQFVVKATQPIVGPLRRIIPAMGPIDSASLLVAFILCVIKAIVLFMVITFQPIIWISALLILLKTIGSLIFWVLLLMAIMSWVSQGRSPVEYVLMQLADPLLRPIRNLLPSMGGIDFSPMVLVLLLYVINMGIAEVLQATGNVLLPGLWMAL